MEEILRRKEGESELDFHKRVIYGKLVDKTLNDMDYRELSTYAYDKEYSSDVARRMFYGSRNTLDLIENDRVENISDVYMLKEIEEKKLELKKERMKLNTLRTITNRDLRETARIELYLEQLKEAIENIKPLYTPNKENYNFDAKEDKVGLLGISDVHFGKIVEIKDLKGNIINRYNEDVFKNRMDKLFWEIRNIIIKEKLEKIVIYNLSDCIDGILRISQLKNLQYGIIDSVIKFSEFIAEWLNTLSNYIAIE